LSEVINFYPHEGQKKLLKSRKRFIFSLGGNRSGKSTGGVFWAFQQAKPNTNGMILSNCYDNQTEIMTRDGWKLFKDLSAHDSVLVMKDSDGGGFTYMKPYKVINQAYNGVMMGGRNTKIDFLVTPNHDMLAKISGSSALNHPFKKYPCVKLYGRGVTFTKILGTWRGRDCSKGEDWLEFLGYYFAEGSSIVKKYGANMVYRIVLTTRGDYEYVKDLLSRVNVHATIVKKRPDIYDFVINNKSLAKEFIKYGNSRTKSIPRWVLQLDKKYLLSFFNGYYQGDGYKHGTTSRAKTASKQLADDLQELCLKVGWSADIRYENYSYTTNPLYVLAINDKRTGKDNVHLQSYNWYTVDYDSTIHCVDCGGLPVYVRRNGKPFWSFQTYDQISLAIMPLFFDKYFPMLKKYFKARDRTLYLPNGAKVFIRSLDDPDFLKGPDIHWIWVDEADKLKRSTWDILRSRVATTRGRILLTSSIYPNGWIYSNIYRPMKDLQDPARKEYKKYYEFIDWESRMNPEFSEDEWNLLKKTTDPVTFAREYESKFVFASGKVFGGLLDYGLIDDIPENVSIIKYVFGLDYGINDPTAIVVIGYGSDAKWYIIDEYYKPNSSIQDVNYYLNYFIKKYGRPYKTCQDYAGGIARLSLISEANVVDADKQVDAGIKLLRDLIYQKKLYVLRRCVNTIKEVDNYQFKDQDGHRDEPEDRWNHAADAVRYAIHTCFFELCGLETTKPEEEVLPAFWQRKKEQGLYKDGQLLDNKEGENDYADSDYIY